MGDNSKNNCDVTWRSTYTQDCVLSHTDSKNDCDVTWRPTYTLDCITSHTDMYITNTTFFKFFGAFLPLWRQDSVEWQEINGREIVRGMEDECELDSHLDGVGPLTQAWCGMPPLVPQPPPPTQLWFIAIEPFQLTACVMAQTRASNYTLCSQLNSQEMNWAQGRPELYATEMREWG